MKFLTDEDVYAVTAQFLRSLGHDVVTASQLGLSRAKDSDLLQIAQQQNRIFVSRDRDFGGLVFVGSALAGIILLASFVVVEPGRHRIRKPAAGQAP